LLTLAPGVDAQLARNKDLPPVPGFLSSLREGMKTMDRRRRIADAVGRKLDAAEERANAATTLDHVRDTLVFLGFEEFAPGRFVRLDGPDGRARTTDAARFLTTVQVSHLVGNAAALHRVVQRFSRVHGRIER
jgi:hypothetical protein